MRFAHPNRRRGGIILLIVIGILSIAIWSSLNHAGRLLRLVAVQRETMQRLRSSDVPARRDAPAPCEAKADGRQLPEQPR